jgi:dihydroorotase
MYDFVVKNASCPDPETGISVPREIYVKNGRFVEKGSGTGDEVAETFDAAGKIVMPGLVDAHAHVQYVGNNGVHADVLCPPSGVTTVVDGGSTGWLNYEQFAELNSLRFVTNVRAFVHVSPFGVIDSPNAETHDPRYINEDRLAELFETSRNPPLGLKLRMDRTTLADNDLEPLRKAAKIADRISSSGRRCPLGVHCANLPDRLEPEAILDLLRAGDIFVHAFQNRGKTIFDEKGKVIPAARKARERGVYFDNCHGRIHWSFGNLRKAIADGFVPDIISSDVFRGSAFVKPGFSLTHAMCVALAAGMEIKDILRAVCATPARVLGLEREVGKLETGRIADLTILDLAEKPVRFFDRFGETVVSDKIFVPLLTMRSGYLVFRQMFF